ncbi:CinA family protein (plasmid) [Tistrella mobilis]|uniref:CinA family protein n=1 Tax=Tistrella mobilis TaxID=171437 RepID=UPI003555FC80
MTDTLSPALPADLDRRIHEVMDRICARGYRLATAESCTGGLIASVLTDVPGCAHVFERGFVVYSPEAKREILGVSQLLLDGPGPVSEPVARAMAEGALARSIAEMAIAVTGFAGPGGPGDEPGLVHVAVAMHRRPTLHRVARFQDGSRGAVRLGALSVVLELMEAQLEGAPAA